MKFLAGDDLKLLQWSLRVSVDSERRRISQKKEKLRRQKVLHIALRCPFLVFAPLLVVLTLSNASYLTPGHGIMNGRMSLKIATEAEH